MARRSVLVLVIMLVTILGAGCSATQAGNGVVGSMPVASATTTSAPATTEPATTAPATTAPATTAPATSEPATSAGTSSSGALPSSDAVPSRSALPSSGATSSNTRTSSAMPSSTTAASAATGTPVFALCPTVSSTDVRGTVSCLRTSLSTFWSGQLNQVVDQPVVVEPTAAQVPKECRSAITTTSAFTCQVDDTVYLNTGLLESARTMFTPAEVPYVFAAVLGHEIGHVVQAAVDQPGYTDTGDSQQISQRIEQQADCLDGVWAHAVIAAHQLDRTTFVRVTGKFITSISSNPEIAGHGTPPQRAAALAKGLKNGRPQDCQLATFS